MFKFLFTLFTLFSLLFAQTKKETPKTLKDLLEESEKSSSKEEPTKKKEIEEKYYAKLQYPPGFYEGAFFVSFIGGNTLAPNGSFIEHEKAYDSILQRKIYNREVDGVFTSREGNGVYFKSVYTPGYASQFDFEYAWKEHFGVGFSVLRNSIQARRQDIIPGISYSRDFAEPYPRQRTIYDGRSFSFLATYHFIPKNFFDPYIALRAGITTFQGEAHSKLVHDPFVNSNEITNGLGYVLGAGGGLNIYIGRYFGIKAEVDYYKHYLRADQFSNRTIGSYQAMVGVFFNLSNIQYQLENE